MPAPCSDSQQSSAHGAAATPPPADHRDVSARRPVVFLVSFISASSLAVAALLTAFAARPLVCVYLPEGTWPLTSGSTNHPRDLSEALVKALLPLPKTSWDNWPCMPGNSDIWLPPSEWYHPERTSVAQFTVRTLNQIYFEWRDETGQTHHVLQRVPELSLYEAVGWRGGHLWHVSLDHALSRKDYPDYLALLLCSCSPVYHQPLARRFREGFARIDDANGRSLAGFDGHGCRTGFCEQGPRDNKPCEEHCENPCTELSGDHLNRECGGCASDVTCHPGADGYRD